MNKNNAKRIAVGLAKIHDHDVRPLTCPPRHKDGPAAKHMTHMFDRRRRENGIEHRPTKPKHPWTNGQVERMNRTIREVTVKRFHYDDHQ